MEQSLNSGEVQVGSLPQEEGLITIRVVNRVVKVRVLQLLLAGGRGTYPVEDLGEGLIMLLVDRITDIKKARAHR